MAKSTKTTVEATRTQLRRILRKHARGSLKAQRDARGNDRVVGRPTERSQGKDVWFGEVRTGKSYVSYHLMPVYAFPDLLDAASPELKKRMQGKSCFNFRQPDTKLFKELDRLTANGYRRFKQEGFIR